MLANFRYDKLARRLLAAGVLAAVCSHLIPLEFVLAQNIDAFTSQEIKDLNKQITDKTKSIKDLDSKAGEYNKIIEQKRIS